MNETRTFAARRQRSVTRTLAVGLVAMFLCSANANAENDPPPVPWPADAIGATHVTFDFSRFDSPDTPPDSRTGTQNWGDPVTPRSPGEPTVRFTPGEWEKYWDDYRKDWYWTPKDRPGDTRARLDFEIPNYDEQNFMKDIFITIFAESPGTLRVQEMYGILDGSAAGVTVKEVDHKEGFPAIGIHWYQEHWQLFPNPDREFFTLMVQERTKLFEVDVDSVCYTPPVPEPETYAMMLTGLGLLGLTARRRRQKQHA